MAQNVYDDDVFFAGYAALPRSVLGLDGAPEWPALRGLLPPMTGRDVVDLGCGYGWFARWAVAQGSARVLAVDLSARMLARARELTGPTAAITYEQQDLERATLPGAAFDVAFSSLTLHYLADLDAFLAAVAAAVRPGGAFVVSAEHPVYTAPSRPAFAVDDAGRRTWPVDRYLDEGPRTTDWLAPGVVKHHRTMATYVGALHRAGFSLTELVEYGPTHEELATHPEWAGERDRPMFVLFAAVRRP